MKKFLSNSSEDTHAIAIVNCIKKKVPCHSNDCRLKSTLLYKARHLKDKTFFLKPLFRILIRTIIVFDKFVICILFNLVTGQNVSHKFFRHEAVENGNVMKNMLEPNELNKVINQSKLFLIFVCFFYFQR